MVSLTTTGPAYVLEPVTAVISDDNRLVGSRALLSLHGAGAARQHSGDGDEEDQPGPVRVVRDIPLTPDWLRRGRSRWHRFGGEPVLVEGRGGGHSTDTV